MDKNLNFEISYSFVFHLYICFVCVCAWTCVCFVCLYVCMYTCVYIYMCVCFVCYVHLPVCGCFVCECVCMREREMFYLTQHILSTVILRQTYG